MQKWRRGGGDMPCSPTEWGVTIDDCIRLLRKLSDEQFNELMNDSNRRKQRVLPPSHEGGFPHRKVGEGMVHSRTHACSGLGEEDRQTEQGVQMQEQSCGQIQRLKN